MRKILVAALLFLSSTTVVANDTVETGEIVEGLRSSTDNAQKYALYLPSYFSFDKKWPALIVIDPGRRSRVSLEVFEAGAEKYGWIVLSAGRTEGATGDTNERVLNALWNELARFPVEEGRVYAGGLSAGAMISWLLADGVDGRIAGVIDSGGRFPDGWEKHSVSFSHFGAAGTLDFNNLQVREIDSWLEENDIPHRYEVFEGGHQWMPAELGGEAIAWMELDAMRRDLRERDHALIAELYSADVSKARKLEEAGQMTRALRRWEAIDRTFDGLISNDADSHAKALRRNRDVRKALKDERKWDAYERQMRRQTAIATGSIRLSDGLVPIGRIIGELHVNELKGHVEAGGYRGQVAQRVMSSMFGQMSGFLATDLFRREEYARAALALQVAEELRPGIPGVRYNLACALARAGSKKEAMEALRGAIDAGFNDIELLEEDTDLASLRENVDYGQIVAEVRSAAD